MSCAPPSGWAVAEWTVDAGPLVMGARVRGFFSVGTIVSVSSYMEYREGGLSLHGRVFFRRWGTIYRLTTLTLMGR
jgi:hypothetical protein